MWKEKPIFACVLISTNRITPRLSSGAHHQEPATTPYSCHGGFIDRSIFSLNLSRIQTPKGTSVSNCNKKHGLMLTCRYVHVRPHCFILTEASSCRLELAYFAGKISKNRLVCKNAVALVYYGSYRLLVMGSWHHHFRDSQFYLSLLWWIFLRVSFQIMT